MVLQDDLQNTYHRYVDGAEVLSDQGEEIARRLVEFM